MKQLVCPRDHRESVSPGNPVAESWRGEVEALEAGEPSQALAPDGDPRRAWQAFNKLGFVTGLLRDSGDDKQEALDSAVPGTRLASLEKEQRGASSSLVGKRDDLVSILTR